MHTPKRIRWYFRAAAIVLILGIGKTGWEIFQGQVLREYSHDPNVPPSSIDYFHLVVLVMLPSALFGMAAPFVKRPRSVRIYFAWAALFGGIGIFCGYQFLRLTHLGCGDNCVPSVPTYTAIGWMALVALVPAALVPGVLALAPWGSTAARVDKA